MTNIYFAFLMFFLLYTNSYAKECTDGKTLKYYDMMGDEVQLSSEERKRKQKKITKINYFEFKWRKLNLRLNNKRLLIDSSGKQYESFQDFGRFNWLRVYKYNDQLIIRIGYNDGVDIDTSTLYLLDSKTLKKISQFQVPCMHALEKLFVESGKLTYACDYQVEREKGKVFTYSDATKKWSTTIGPVKWSYYKSFKDLPMVDSKLVEQLVGWENLSNYDKRCRY